MFWQKKVYERAAVNRRLIVVSKLGHEPLDATKIYTAPAPVNLENVAERVSISET